MPDCLDSVQSQKVASSSEKKKDDDKESSFWGGGVSCLCVMLGPVRSAKKKPDSLKKDWLQVMTVGSWGYSCFKKYVCRYMHWGVISYFK